MKKILLPFLLIFNFFVASAQNPADIETAFGPVPGFNGIVYKIVQQPDGNILVGGTFTKYKGHDYKYFVRLLPDGNVDPAFNMGTGFNNSVTAIALQTDGKMIVIGNFSSYNSISTNKIIRLNSDGSFDNTFQIGIGFVIHNQVIVQPDDKVIVTGYLSSSSPYKIVRLNTDGSVDTTFIAGSGFNDRITSIALQTDGKMVLTGDFSMYNGYTRNGIIRLNADGTVDLTFSIGIGFGPSGGPEKVTVQADGKIVVCGGFNSYKSQTEYGLLRLLPDGTKDTSFDVGTAFMVNGNNIGDLFIDNNNNIIIAGSIVNYNGIAITSNCIRINPNGNLDSSLAVQSGIAYTALSQNDGKLILGGDGWLYRFQSNGSQDLSFDYGRGLNGSVNATLIQPDGKIIVGGGFSLYNLNREYGLMRFNTDGTKDTTFATSLIRGQVRDLLLQPDGKIIAHGDFRFIGDPQGGGHYMIRLNADGSRDTSFTPNIYGSTTSCIALQPDGKILMAAGDYFIPSPGISIGTGIVRMSASGIYDPTFNVGTSFSNGYPYAMTVQPDGKIIIAGTFTGFNGGQHLRIVRLLPDGSTDPTFITGEGFNGSPHAITLQPDGKIIAGGYFNTYNMIPVSGIVRINTDGSYDTTFHSGTSNYNVTQISLQPDGKIVTLGTTQLQLRMFRYNADGSVDANFNIGSFTASNSPSVNTINVQPDGKLILGGQFSQYQGVDSSNLVRLWGGHVLSTDTFSKEKLVLYPNPTRDFIHLHLPSGVDFKSYEVFDLTGKTLIQNSDSATIDVQSLSKGMYFIKVKGQHAEEYNTKFLKE